MDHDVELMRALLFVLESRQTSPRMTVVIDILEEARELAVLPEAVAMCLRRLAEFEYIEGGGENEPGFWMFRRLTRKGRDFVRAVREPEDWERIKDRYTKPRVSPDE